MGWLKLGARTEIRTSVPSTIQEDLKSTIEHIETVTILSNPQQSYPFAEITTPNADLPFIPPATIAKHTSASTGGLYIVVNDVVFDCTNFVMEHPGGDQIIRSFAGAECSWQFWRFHGEREMHEYGKPLRVGRTEGMVNRYPEPVRYVGLRRLGGDEWD